MLVKWVLICAFWKGFQRFFIGAFHGVMELQWFCCGLKVLRTNWFVVVSVAGDERPYLVVAFGWFGLLSLAFEESFENS